MKRVLRKAAQRQLKDCPDVSAHTFGCSTLLNASYEPLRPARRCRYAVFWCPLQYQAVIGDCLTSIEEVGHMSDTELLPKPKREAEPVRRLGEVFTGAGRRRRWTAEQKARIVAEMRAERRYARLCAGTG